MGWSLLQIQSHAVEALFQRYFKVLRPTKIDSEHTQDYRKLFSVCKAEILQVTVNKVEVLSSF